MEVVAPELTKLYELPDDGPYRVLGAYTEARFDPRLARGPGVRAMSATQFDRFTLGRTLLNGLLALEEAYDVIMGNYIDFEEVLLRLSVNELAQRRPLGESGHFDHARRSCHRFLANLLSSAKAFQDQAQRLTSAMDKGTSAHDLTELRLALSEAYDTKLGYRFMDALRNHTQHHGVSVSGVTFTRGLRDFTGPGQFVSASPYLNLTELRSNSKFKASVLTEISVTAERHGDPDQLVVPLLPLVRDYLAGLSTIIVKLRALYAERERAALNVVYAAYYRYTGFFTPDFPVGLLVTSERTPGKDTYYFGTDSSFRARRLREANGDLKLLTITEMRQ